MYVVQLIGTKYVKRFGADSSTQSTIIQKACRKLSISEMRGYCTHAADWHQLCRYMFGGLGLAKNTRYDPLLGQMYRWT